MAEHTVQSYDSDLTELRNSLMRMGIVTQQMLRNASLALKDRDSDLALRVVSTDSLVDSLHRITEEKAVLTIARRQPVAGDLRELVSSIRVAADVERVGDLAKNIAKRASIIAMSMPVPVSLLTGFDHMSRSVFMQYVQALESYAEHSLEKANRVWNNDVEIDGLYQLIFRDSLTQMMEEPRNITLLTHFLLCVKNLERIGDHATNIAETVQYIITGKTNSETRPRLNNTDISPA